MLKNRRFAYLCLSVLIFSLSVIIFSPDPGRAFQYTGASTNTAPSSSNVKIITPNALTPVTFAQAPTTCDWFCSGGRTLIADFDNDGVNDVIVASPYGEYNFSDQLAGMVMIYKGPISSASHGGTYSWDSGNWDAAPNTAATGYILGANVKEHTGYAIASGNFGSRALVIGRPYETGTPSEVAVIFTRAIANLNGNATRIKSNMIDMKQMGDATQTLGKNDMKNFSLLIKNIPGANAPAVGGIYPHNSIGAVSGMSLACGDVTGDSVDDIIIGCPNDGGTAGSVYIIKGKTNWKDNDSNTAPLEIDVTTMTVTDGYKINGNAAGDFFGASLLVSNIYGDSRGELIIGATGAQAKGGIAIIPGGTIDSWNVLTYNIGLITETKVVLSPSGSNGLRMGHALAAGKFHDSGAANNDLIVTEFADADNATAAYVIFGNATLPAANPSLSM